jgi:hypothetical protein
MFDIATYQRKTFLKDHPPVFARALLASSGAEQTLLAGTVLGISDDGKVHAYVAGDMLPHAVLAEDVVIPASGDKYALIYVHAAVIAPELVWHDDVSAAQQRAALDRLRTIGIYVSEA